MTPVKETFLGMRLECRAGSKILPTNLSVSSEVQVFLAMRRLALPHACVHTCTHACAHKSQPQPVEPSLTLRAMGKRGGWFF